MSTGRGEASNIIGFPGSGGRGGSSFPPGGGGAYDPMMEARVAALEASIGRIEAGVTASSQTLSAVQKDIGDLKRSAVDLADVKKDIGDIRKVLTDQGNSLSRLDGRVGALPTTLQMIGFVLAVLALAGIGRYLAP